jgi:hypothetical protein
MLQAEYHAKTIIGHAGKWQVASGKLQVKKCIKKCGIMNDESRIISLKRKKNLFRISP